jgi:hypothetical protein
MRFFPDSIISSTLHTGLPSQVAVNRRTNARSTKQCFFLNRGAVDRELLSRDISRKPRASEPSARDSVLRRTITTYSYLDISIFRVTNQNFSAFRVSREPAATVAGWQLLLQHIMGCQLLLLLLLSIII